jgi:uridine monophosphate synthetase
LNSFKILSINIDKPMVLKRKDGKEYGTKKMIEGFYKANDRCLVIEDVVTSGQSILETFHVKINI